MTTAILGSVFQTARRKNFRVANKDAAMGVLRDAIAEAMKARINESPSIKSKMDDVAEAVTAVKRALIGALPKMRRAGRPDVSDLKVTVNELTPVSEPLYAVA